MSRAADVADIVRSAIEAFDFAALTGSIPVTVTRTYSDPEKLAPNSIEITVYPLTRAKKREGKTIVVETCEVDVLVQRKLTPTDTENLDLMLDLIEQLDQHLETADAQPFTWQVADGDQFLWLPEMLHAKNTFAALIPLKYAIKRGTGN